MRIAREQRHGELRHDVRRGLVEDYFPSEWPRRVRHDLGSAQTDRSTTFEWSAFVEMDPFDDDRTPASRRSGATPGRTTRRALRERMSAPTTRSQKRAGRREIDGY